MSGAQGRAIYETSQLLRESHMNGFSTCLLQNAGLDRALNTMMMLLNLRTIWL